MNKLRFGGILFGLLLLILPQAVCGKTASTRLSKRYDFNFQSIDLTKVVTQLARLEGRGAVFPGKMQTMKVDLSLNDSTPAEAMRLILESNGYYVSLRDNVYYISGTAGRDIANIPTEIIPLKNTLATDLTINVATFLGDKGSVSANTHINALVIKADASLIGRVRTLVHELDQESSQVFIEAKVVETTRTFSRELGVEWGKSLTDRVSLPQTSLSARATNDAFIGAFSTRIGTSGMLAARLTAGETNGDVKVVSSPKITTLSGETATIDSSTTFNVRTVASSVGVVTPGTGTNTGTGSGTVTSGLEQVTAGIKLSVTPYILSDKTVRMKINLSKSEPDFARQVDGIPGISDNTAITSLVVRTGETASIGGIILDKQSEDRNGMPFLSAIPVLGYLFGNVKKDTEDRELMIFLTPTIFKRSDTQKTQEGAFQPHMLQPRASR